MLLASFNTLPLVNLKPELGKSGIGGIGIAGKWVADMLGVFFFFFPSLDGVLYVISAQQQGQPQSLSKLSTLTAHRTCCVTAHQPIKTEEERSSTRVRA